MDQYAWQDCYAVGVKDIDDQHKMLFRLINKLHESIKNGDSNKTVNEILPELVKYTMYHFDSEEVYMRKYRFEGYALHKDKHLEFITELKGHIQELVEDESGLSEKLLTFLSNWLVNHIQSMDQELGPFLAKNL